MAKKYHTEVSRRLSPDGREVIITEKDVRCTPECRHESTSRRSKRPVTLEVPSSSSSAALKERLPTPYRFDFTPDDKRQRQQRRSAERDSHYYQSATKPIPIPPPRRSSSSSHRRESETVPLGFYELLYNRGNSPPSSGRYVDADDVDPRYRRNHHNNHRSSHYRRRSESPMEPFPFKDEAYYRERGGPSLLRRSNSSSNSKPLPPRIIQDNNTSADVIYGSSPLVGSFGTSYGSPPAAAHHHHSATASSSSPPKQVRWQDDPRAKQNAKISSRKPFGGRTASFSGGENYHHHVKGILKQPPETQAPAVQYPDVGQEDEQRQMLEGLRERMNRRAGGSAARRYSLDEVPPRRFSGGGGGGGWGEKASSRGRRGEVFYDDGRRW